MTDTRDLELRLREIAGQYDEWDRHRAIELEAADALAAMRWISVAERLPTHIHSILMRVTGGPLHHGEDYTAIGIYNDKKRQWQENDGDDDVVVEVSLWMPLPAAPKE